MLHRRSKRIPRFIARWPLWGFSRRLQGVNLAWQLLCATSMNLTRMPLGASGAGRARRDDGATPELDALAHLMDGAFRIPGLNIRFGLDALIGLIPGIGDLLTKLVSIYLLTLAQRYGVPRITTLRMGLNIGIDAVLGAIPFVGDLFDLAWKANERNVALLRRHINTPPHERQSARRGDWLFVVGVVAVLIAVLAAALYGAYLAAAAVVGWAGR
jgi:hypothetical protein